MLSVIGYLERWIQLDNEWNKWKSVFLNASLENYPKMCDFFREL